MGASEDKKIATEYFANVSAGRRKEALEMLAEDVTWWAAGFGVMGKAQFAEMLTDIDKIISGSLQLTLKRMTAEDDRVAAEAESDADLVNGKHYHNTYHFLLVIREGKIRDFKEYHDSKYAAEVFGDLLRNPGTRRRAIHLRYTAPEFLTLRNLSDRTGPILTAV